MHSRHVTDDKIVKLSLCLVRHHAIRTVWRSRVIAPHILNLGNR
jgi:hypothetical protein